MDRAAMSVINQVLNQLEQRGAHTAHEQSMVRAVPLSRRNYTVPLLVFGLALIAGIAVWQWMQSRKPVLSSVEGPGDATVSIVPMTGNSPGSYELDKLIPPHQPAMVVTAPITATGSGQVSGMPATNRPASLSVPALQLSFELNSVPLPSSLSVGNSNFASIPVVSLQPDNLPPKQQPIKTAISKAKVAAQTSKGASPMKQVSPAQQADAEFRKAVALMQQGRITDAVAGYETALRLDAGHDAARQALVALLLENKRGSDAEGVLLERLKSKPDHTGFTMLLARLQLDRGAVGDAIATLEKSLPYAGTQADYRAFLAALLQRQNRNEEAIAHYQIVTQLAPGNGVWLMGYGISLQAIKRNTEAKELFKKALDTQTLSPELQAYVQQKLKDL